MTQFAAGKRVERAFPHPSALLTRVPIGSKGVILNNVPAIYTNVVLWPVRWDNIGDLYAMENTLRVVPDTPFESFMAKINSWGPLTEET